MTEKNPNVTKQGILVAPGQVWIDCDGRGPAGAPRKVTVESVENGTAIVLASSGKRTKIAVKRMHPHSTGYRLQDVKA